MSRIITLTSTTNSATLQIDDEESVTIMSPVTIYQDDSSISFLVDELSYSLKLADNITIDGVAFSGTLSQLKTAVQATMPTSGGGATEVTVYQLKTVLTDAQIKALPSTPIEVVPAPGVNKALNVFAAVIRCDFSAGAYTNIDPSYVDLALLPANLPIVVKDTSASIDLIPFALADIRNYTLSGQFSISTGGYVLALGYDDQTFNNKSAELWWTNELGNFTGGNTANTMSITVLYSIVDL
jgi:hypothetical protein